MWNSVIGNQSGHGPGNLSRISKWTGRFESNFFTLGASNIFEDKSQRGHRH
jgi:hypothetical protein